MASAGEEVPVRRGPMLTPSERAKAGGDGRPPLNDRVMHAFTVMANVMQRRHAEAGSRKVISGLARVGGFMSIALLSKRMLLPTEEAEIVIDVASEAGLVVIEEDEHAGKIARLTQTGYEKAAEIKRNRDASTAEFLSPLSEEEKETLETLVRKLLAMH